ncbi:MULTISPECIES: YcnI family copper-binding membrane protein [Protofrankia]|uniref:Nuclear export factor GLE1 n=1 Tax=Candidatus Protofrankia datiscae TaxID=2716812 RepID=F8B009_9ACTN|nr:MULTISPECIES: YcnI family protein [Protofrankia]AEH11706.1 nuclear export factor GLE1 [Candidatus Protofrankia datiscae]
MSRTTRGIAVLGAALTGVIAFALPASAHVTVQPKSAAAGSYTTLSFKIPTERDDASTTKLEIQFPTDTPISSVTIEPHLGWSYQVAKTKLAEPIKTDDGSVSEVISQITWTASSADTAIKPGEFAVFNVSAGPLPAQAGTVAFKALQTYSNGEVVRWIDVAQPGQDEPEHPAPSLTLTAAAAGGADAHGASAASASPAGTGTADTTASHSVDSSDGTARGLGIAGLVVGLIGIGAGVAALRGGRGGTTTS